MIDYNDDDVIVGLAKKVNDEVLHYIFLVNGSSILVDKANPDGVLFRWKMKGEKFMWRSDESDTWGQILDSLIEYHIVGKYLDEHVNDILLENM